MEQKKIIWIIAGVSVSLILVVVLAFFVFGPRNAESYAFAKAQRAAKARALARAQSSQSDSPSEWKRVDFIASAADGEVAKENASSTEESEASPLPSSSATSSSGNIIFYYGDREAGERDYAELKPQEDGSLVIDLKGAPRPTKPQEPEKKEELSLAQEKEKTVPSTASPTPVAKASPKKTNASPAKTTPKQQPARVAKPKPKLVEQFFVQTGSYSTKARADAVKAELAEKKIVSIVEIREIEGKTYFRIRVGPYHSKNEAEYWLSLIKTLEGFEDSYVTMTKRPL